MPNLKKDKEKKIIGLNLGFLLISEMGLLSSVKIFRKMKIKVNHNISSNHKYHSHKQVSKAEESPIETDDGSVDFHLEIAKKIDMLGSAFQKKSGSSSQNIVELRSPFEKKPEIPQFMTEVELENDFTKTDFKEGLFEANLPSGIYYNFKKSKNVKNKISQPPDKHSKTSMNSAIGIPRIKIKKEKEQDISNNHEKEDLSYEKVEEKKDNIWTEEEFKKIKKEKNGLYKKEEWAEKKEEELKKEIEELRQEKELLKKQEKELKKKEKQKERERKLEAENALKEKKEAEKQKRLEEKQRLKEEKIKELELEKKAKKEAEKEEKLKKKKLKEELIKELELKKKIKEEEKRKKSEEKKALKEEKTKEEKEKVAVTEKSKDETDETVKELDELILSKKKTAKEKTFLDDDVEKIIPVIDTLLEKLPDDVIAEFAESDDFALYEKVVKKYKNK